eukprot:scaffold4078_cov68-Phaeocystis_antarctica.AAC.11
MAEKWGYRTEKPVAPPGHPPDSDIRCVNSKDVRENLTLHERTSPRTHRPPPFPPGASPSDILAAAVPPTRQLANPNPLTHQPQPPQYTRSSPSLHNTPNLNTPNQPQYSQPQYPQPPQYLHNTPPQLPHHGQLSTVVGPCQPSWSSSGSESCVPSPAR